MLLITTLIFYALFQCASSQQSKLSPCSLQWVTYIQGEEFPEHAVLLEGQLFIAGRGSFVGTADNRTKTGSFYNALNATGAFSILTNPKDCAVSWVEAHFGVIPEPEYAQQISPGRYVARRGGGTMKGVTLMERNEPPYCYGIEPDTGGNAVYLYCEVLKATENLMMDISEVKFLNPLEEYAADFMGKDEIINQGPVTLEHTVSHEKIVTIRYQLTESRSFATSTYTHVGIDLSIGLFSLRVAWEHRHDRANGVMKEIIKEKDETTKSLRTIIVPPFQTLQACSILHTAQQNALPYTGVGAYSIPGRSADYVENILLQENYTKGDIIKMNATHVFVRIEGEFSIDSPMRTQLIVHSPGDPEGCDDIRRQIEKVKHLQFQKGTKAEIAKEQKVLKDMLG